MGSGVEGELSLSPYCWKRRERASRTHHACQCRRSSGCGFIYADGGRSQQEALYSEHINAVAGDVAGLPLEADMEDNWRGFGLRGERARVGRGEASDRRWPVQVPSRGAAMQDALPVSYKRYGFVCVAGYLHKRVSAKPTPSPTPQLPPASRRALLASFSFGVPINRSPGRA
jgi:hypothetical protein